MQETDSGGDRGFLTRYMYVFLINQTSEIK